MKTDLRKFYIYHKIVFIWFIYLRAETDYFNETYFVSIVFIIRKKRMYLFE